MSNVISLNSRRREPHLEGTARCAGCNYEWVAVAPVGVVELECPACGSARGGRMKESVERDGLKWVCACGSDLFRLSDQGAYCIACGDFARGWAE